MIVTDLHLTKPLHVPKLEVRAAKRCRIQQSQTYGLAGARAGLRVPPLFSFSAAVRVLPAPTGPRLPELHARLLGRPDQPYGDQAVRGLTVATCFASHAVRPSGAAAAPRPGLWCRLQWVAGRALSVVTPPVAIAGVQVRKEQGAWEVATYGDVRKSLRVEVRNTGPRHRRLRVQ